MDATSCRKKWCAKTLASQIGQIEKNQVGSKMGQDRGFQAGPEIDHPKDQSRQKRNHETVCSMDKPKQERRSEKREQKRNPSRRFETLSGQGQEDFSKDIEKGRQQKKSKDELFRNPGTEGENKGIVMSVNSPNPKWHPQAEAVLEEEVVIGETNDDTRNHPE
jgi:hypothetical protein